MTDTIERLVTVDPDYFGPGDGVYVIPAGSEGYSCLGFNVLEDRAERIAIELTGRGYLDSRSEKELVGRVKEARGTTKAYDLYRNALDLLKRVCSEEGDRAVYDLTPQLIGLEGCRVEVTDKHGERRRFIVGRSMGWAPCHLEIPRRNSSGGMAASLEYEDVRVLERVR